MYATGLARRERCRLVVAYVMSPGPFEWAVIGGGGVLADLRADLSRTVEAEVRALSDECPYPVTFVSRVGRPTDCLSAIADEVRADVVVVGVSRGWRRWCGLSVAAGLVRTGRWPVVVVP
jgi:nucleotide-binding universal stress UspA family protein